MKKRFRIGMKPLCIWMKQVPIILLLPYAVTFLINGAETAVGSRTVSAETLVPILTAQQIPRTYEEAAIAAQTVIARTNLLDKTEEKGSLLKVLREAEKPSGTLWKTLSQARGIFEKAADQTRGQVLTWKGQVQPAPFHVLSGGETRDGQEVFRDKDFSYLQSVDSAADRESESYLNSTYISERKLPLSLHIEERDGAGYVQSLRADANVVEGEAFRQGMGLVSANFTIQKIDDRYRFLCKGIGHGLGFSQYGGNEMAKRGARWQEILKTYFPGMKLLFLQNDV